MDTGQLIFRGCGFVKKSDNLTASFYCKYTKFNGCNIDNLLLIDYWII